MSIDDLDPKETHGTGTTDVPDSEGVVTLNTEVVSTELNDASAAEVIKNAAYQPTPSEDVFDRADDSAQRYLEESELPPPLAEEPKEIFVPEQAPVDFKLERRVCGEATENLASIISYIQENFNTINKVFENNSQLLEAMHNGELTSSKHSLEWLGHLFSGLNNISLDSAPNGATTRKDSTWRQGVYDNGGNAMRPGRPEQDYDRTKQNSKEAALAYLSYKSGMGGNYEAFLPDSGIWVRLRRPALGEIIAMQTELQAIKVQLGNDTKGLAFSHAGFRMIDAVTDLAINCIVHSNRKYTTPSDLEFDISIFDETILHHALAAVMYPDGFNYSVPCIADPDTCNNVIKFKMNMSNMVWFDNAVFTTEQRKFIAKRFSPGSDDDFKAYRDSFTIGNSKVVWLGEVGIKLSPPSIAKRRESARIWYDTLIEMSKGAFNESPDGDQRYEYIRRLQQATKATQYSHWVEAIYLKNEDALTLDEQLFSDDPELILEFISSTVSEKQYFETFMEAVNQYSNESIIAIVALPSHNCTKCNSPQGIAFNERLPHLVPLDLLATFFTLAAQRVIQSGVKT